MGAPANARGLAATRVPAPTRRYPPASGQGSDLGASQTLTRALLCGTPNLVTYQTRLADARLTELLAEFPAVMINGPRAAGKTTTARHFSNEAVSLDSPADSAAFRADPDDALRGRKEPLLLDEWQEAPDAFGLSDRVFALPICVIWGA